jgi:hypothetical protein
MQFRNHVVVVTTIVVLGASAILGATVDSNEACMTPISASGSASYSQFSTTAATCSGATELSCATTPPVAEGQYVHLWGVQGGCFGPKP